MSDTTSVYQAYQGNTYLFGGNAPYVEEMYENYLANPGSVPDTWRDYFDALQHVPAVTAAMPRTCRTCPWSMPLPSAPSKGGTKVVVASADAEMGRKRTAVQQLIAAYRNVGALGRSGPAQAHRAPQDSRTGALVLRLQRCRPGNVFDTSNTFFGKDNHVPARAAERAARNLLRHHRRRVHVHHRPGAKALVAAKAGKHPQQAQFHAEKKKHILDRLTAAEGLERFLHTKYVGQKRFSLEGGESFIAAMDELIQRPAPRACRKS
jgi:2-oxoglutarate dehydrogenase E1 component